ncbi:hypothetical protein QEN19_001763 [Hanseniaspora menglaensis]
MDSIKNTILKSSSPVTSIAYISFKIVPVVVYVLAYNFASFTNITILLIILKSVDFYAAQNIFGRKLVGLRWSYDTDFKYESYKQYNLKEYGNALDSILFWYSMYISVFAWSVFAIVSLFGFKFIYFFIVSYCLFLDLYQYMGYRGSYYFKPENEQGSSTVAGAVDIMDLVKNFGNFTTLFQRD